MADYNPSRDQAPSGQGRHAAILEEAHENSRRNNDAYRDSFRAEQDDQRFLVGHQWDPVALKERDEAGLVSLTLNDLGQFLDQVVGDMRMHPTAVKVIPADYGASKGKMISDSGRTYTASEVRAGLIRQIEYINNAPMHYVLAGQHAAESGRGWLRVRSDYVNEETFSQDIIVERIKNRWSVLPDCMAQQPDYSDQNNCFVGGWMKQTDWDKKYPGTAPGTIGPNDNSWWGMREGYVRVAEYYYREQYATEMLQLDNGVIVRKTDPKLWAYALASGRVVNQRKVKQWRVKWCKLSYHHMIEEPIEIPGTTIPVIPVLGKVIEGDTDDFTYGLFRFCKDAKMMENYWLSSATQRVAQMPNAPFTGTVNNFKGLENFWQQANKGTPAYLPFNVDPDMPGLRPERVQGAAIPAGEMQLILAFGDKVKASVGFHDASIGNSRNKQSGIAIERLQEESDVGSFVFTDNLRMGVTRVGKVMLEWIPTIYDTERFITIRHPNGETDTIEVNKIGDDGRLVNDLTEGKYDSHAETGPAYSTMRQEAATSGMELTKAFAQVGEGGAVHAIADIVVESMDFPGADRMAKRLRKMVPPGLLDEMEMTEEERAAASQPKPPSPDEIAQQREFEASIAKSNAMLDTADATRAKAKAETASATADLVATLVGPADPAQAEADETAAKESEKAAGKTPAKSDKASSGVAELSGDMQKLVNDLVLTTLAQALAEMGAPDEPAAAAAAPAPAAPAAPPQQGV